ncbi:MAG: hypothetical protein QXF61_07340 [Nitrososphaeria archaeon]
MVSYRNVSEQRITSVLVNNVFDEWEVSGNLSEGDKILVELRYAIEWLEDPMYEPSEFPGVGLFFHSVDVIDPLGNITRFIVTWSRRQGEYVLKIWNITIANNGNNATLDTTILYRPESHAYDGIGGIIQMNGTYKVKVHSIWPSTTRGKYPPSYLGIRKGTIITLYPYTFLLPVGMVFAFLGLLILIYGLTKKKRFYQKLKFYPKKSISKRTEKEFS